MRGDRHADGRLFLSFGCFCSSCTVQLYSTCCGLIFYLLCCFVFFCFFRRVYFFSCYHKPVVVFFRGYSWCLAWLCSLGAEREWLEPAAVSEFFALLVARWSSK